VSKEETDAIFANLPVKRKLLVYFPNAGHENYLLKYRHKWIATVAPFLTKGK
jgi:hypothetical protein